MGVSRETELAEQLCWLFPCTSSLATRSSLMGWLLLFTPALQMRRQSLKERSTCHSLFTPQATPHPTRLQGRGLWDLLSSLQAQQGATTVPGSDHLPDQEPLEGRHQVPHSQLSTGPGTDYGSLVHE